MFFKFLVFIVVGSVNLFSYFSEIFLRQASGYQLSLNWNWNTCHYPSYQRVSVNVCHSRVRVISRNVRSFLLKYAGAKENPDSMHHDKVDVTQEMVGDNLSVFHSS